MIEEADRSLHDALSVLSQTVKETRVVLGGGCAEMAMAVAVDEEAKTTKGKKALAVEAFARALRQVSRRRLWLPSDFWVLSSSGWAELWATTTLRARRSRQSWRTTLVTTRRIWWPSSGRHITRAEKMPVWVRRVVLTVSPTLRLYSSHEGSTIG